MVGAVEGFAAPFPGNKKKKMFETKNREDFIQELMLRRLIREKIRNLPIRLEKKQQIQENKIRNAIRKIILLEKEQDKPHHSTGINVLSDLLKKIIPTLEIDYKKLTTNDKQRRSFSNHILKAAQGVLTREKVEDEADTEQGDLKNSQMQGIGTNNEPALAEAELDLSPDDNNNEQGIDKQIGQMPADPDKEKFIDIDRPSRKKDQEKKNNPMNSFAISGEDETGRNVALQSFQKVEKSIIDSYGSLSDPDDKKIFFDYLLTNLKLWFQRFESELKADVQPPNIPDPEGSTQPDSSPSNNLEI